MDGRVLARWGVPPAHLTAGPARAGDRAGGQVHQTPAEAMRPDVDDVEAVDAAREVPAREEPGGREQGIEHHRLGRGRHGREQERVLELAVPVLARIAGQASSEQDRRRRAGPRLARQRGPGFQRLASGQRELTDAQPRGDRVDHHPDPMPRAERGSQAGGKGERRRAGHAAARGHPGRAQGERPSRAGALVPAGDHALLAGRRQRRPDQRDHGEGAGGGQRRRSPGRAAGRARVARSRSGTSGPPSSRRARPDSGRRARPARGSRDRARPRRWRS